MKSLKVIVDDINDVIQSRLFNNEFYEREELDFISKYIPKNSVIADIGANIGNHTIYFDWFCEPETVYVFEPIERSYKMLLQNIALNYCHSVNVDYLGIALGKRYGFSGVVGSYESNLGATVLKDNGLTSGIYQVPGDSIFYNKKLDFIKIDVEGMELDVLEGLKETIANQKPIMFIEVQESQKPGFFNWMDSHGYEIIKRVTETEWYENYLIGPKQ